MADNALELIRTSEKAEFFANDLPEFTCKVELLKLTENDLTELITIIKNNNENKQ